MDEEGIKKSAILLMSLGEQEAASVIKLLGPKEVQKLGEAMSSLQNVTRPEIENILVEFCNQAEGKTTLGQNSADYIRKVLTSALGDEKAANLIDRILQGGDTSGIEGLKWMDAPSVAELIKDEHPQIIATILVHLDRDQASEILSLFSERLRNDTLLRIATLDSVQPDALRELNDVLTKLLSGSNNIRKTALGGVRAAAEILNFVPTAQETSVIDNIKVYDEELAQKIMIPGRRRDEENHEHADDHPNPDPPPAPHGPRVCPGHPTRPTGARLSPAAAGSSARRPRPGVPR